MSDPSQNPAPVDAADPQTDALDLAADTAQTAPAGAVAVDSDPTAAAAPSSATTNHPSPLARILAMDVPVIVKIAQKKVPFSDVLKFHIGTVIQFDKDPYQYVDLLVNNSKIGAGQPVKVGENFGLKVMQLGPIAETIRSLGQSANP